jgi:CheY-like chemotaxis protein
VRLLVVDDNQDQAASLALLLQECDAVPGYTVSHVETCGTLARTLELLAPPARWECVLLDLNLPDSRGVATLEAVYGVRPDVAVVVVTGANGDRLGNEVIAKGAQDYLLKATTDPAVVCRSVAYAVGRHKFRAVTFGVKQAAEDLSHIACSQPKELRAIAGRLRELAETPFTTAGAEGEIRVPVPAGGTVSVKVEPGGEG